MIEGSGTLFSDDTYKSVNVGLYGDWWKLHKWIFISMGRAQKLKTASFTSCNIILGTFCAACFPIHLIIIVLLHDNTYWLIIYTFCNLPKRTIKTGGKLCTVAHYCNLWNQNNLLTSDLQQKRITSWQCYNSTKQC